MSKRPAVLNCVRGQLSISGSRLIGHFGREAAVKACTGEGCEGLVCLAGVGRLMLQ